VIPFIPKSTPHKMSASQELFQVHTIANREDVIDVTGLCGEDNRLAKISRTPWVGCADSGISAMLHQECKAGAGVMVRKTVNSFVT